MISYPEVPFDNLFDFSQKAVFDKGVVISYGAIALMIAIVIIFGMYGIGYEGKDFIYSSF